MNIQKFVDIFFWFILELLFWNPRNEQQRKAGQIQFYKSSPYFYWGLVALFALFAIRAQGPVYFFCLLLIFLCREAMFFVQLQRVNLAYPKPYFLPMLNPLGSLGLFHSVSDEALSKPEFVKASLKAPFFGMLVSIVVYGIGLCFSKPVSVGFQAYDFVWGDSLITQSIQWVLGIFSSDVQGPYVDLHPIAKAGFAGIWLNAIAFLPIGQLPGAYLMFHWLGHRYVWVSGALLAAMFVLGVTVHYSWVMASVVLLLFVFRHASSEIDGVARGASDLSADQTQRLSYSWAWVGGLCLLFGIPFVPYFFGLV